MAGPAERHEQRQAMEIRHAMMHDDLLRIGLAAGEALPTITNQCAFAPSSELALIVLRGPVVMTAQAVPEQIRRTTSAEKSLLSDGLHRL